MLRSARLAPARPCGPMGSRPCNSVSAKSSAICGHFGEARLFDGENGKYQPRSMLPKAPKRLARSHRGGIGCFCVLSVSSLLAVPAFGGSAYGARLLTVPPLAPAGRAATVAAPPPVAVAVHPATAAPVPAGAVSGSIATTTETAPQAASPPATGIQSAPTVSAAPNTPAASSASAASQTLPQGTSTTPGVPGEANAPGHAPSPRTIDLVASHGGRSHSPEGQAARTPTRVAPPVGRGRQVATEGLPGGGAAEASAHAGEGLPGVPEGPSSPGPLSRPGVPRPAGIPQLVPESGQLHASASSETPLAQALAGATTTYPSPVPIGSSGDGSRAGEFEAGLPRPRALAWTSSTSQPAIVAAPGSGAPACVAASGDALFAQPCGLAGAGARLLGQGGSLLLSADALGIVLRGPPLSSGASGAHYRDVPASVPAGSGSGGISGGSSSSAAGGASGFAVTTLVISAALLLLAGPRIMRRLSLVHEQWLATTFALIPERPG